MKPEVKMSFSCGMEPGVQVSHFCVRPNDDPRMMAMAIKGMVDAAYEAGKKDATQYEVGVDLSEAFAKSIRAIVREELDKQKQNSADPTQHPAGEPYRYCGLVEILGPDGQMPSTSWPVSKEIARLNRAFQLGYDKAKKEGR